MIENASQSIVGVVNKQKSQGIPGFFQSQPSEQEAVEAGTGSGVIFKEEDGKAYIITNNHVIEGADEIEISLSLMEESESYRYYCERKESKQEIELYIFEVLKKHIPITYYI